MAEEQAAAVASPYLLEDEAATYLRMTGVAALQRMRRLGTGPRYRKHGSVPLYTVADLDRWSEEQARTSTQERKAGGRAAASDQPT